MVQLCTVGHKDAAISNKLQTSFFFRSVISTFSPFIPLCYNKRLKKLNVSSKVIVIQAQFFVMFAKIKKS